MSANSTRRQSSAWRGARAGLTGRQLHARRLPEPGVDRASDGDSQLGVSAGRVRPPGGGAGLADRSALAPSQNQASIELRMATLSSGLVPTLRARRENWEARPQSWHSRSEEHTSELQSLRHL